LPVHPGMDGLGGESGGNRPFRPSRVPIREAGRVAWAGLVISQEALTRQVGALRPAFPSGTRQTCFRKQFCSRSTEVDLPPIFHYRV
jgi:hypothetical protein